MAAGLALSEKVIFAGGGTLLTGTAVDTVNIFDVQQRSWASDTLSVARMNLGATFVGDLAFFAGGGTLFQDFSVIDVYDARKGKWLQPAKLHQRRQGLAATSVGQRAIFAGGVFNADSASAAVDIYDGVTHQWSIGKLSQARWGLAGASLREFAFFAGGSTLSGSGIQTSDVIDVFNNDTSRWTTMRLSVGRTNLAAAAAGDVVVFAGGRVIDSTQQGPGGLSDVVDIYNIRTQTWHTAALSQPREFLAAASWGNFIVFAGGNSHSGPNDFTASAVVDVFNVQSGRWISNHRLSQAKGWLSGAAWNDTFYFGLGVDVDHQLSDGIDVFCL